MGNAFVCISDQTPTQTHFASADAPITLVNGLSGSFRQLHEHPKVAEIMLEYPGSFVCRASALCTGQRFVALSADEELSAAVPYCLLPMHKLHKRISTEESNFFTLIATKGERTKAFPTPLRKLSLSVSPWHPPGCLQPSNSWPPSVQSTGSFLQRRISLAESADDSMLGTELEAVPILVRSKSWKPNLETISESRYTNSSRLRAMLQVSRHIKWS